MSSPPICAVPDMSLQDCMVLMTNNHVRHLPVMDNGEVIGIVSIGDVVGSLMRSQEAKINQLENYITGDDYPARVATS
jgi:signal-transduction protein with cAMP-binding, CBS, and nucleotidyltransferase domain